MLHGLFHMLMKITLIFIELNDDDGDGSFCLKTHNPPTKRISKILLDKVSIPGGQDGH